MKPFPLRPLFGWALALCLAFALGCSAPEPPAKPPVLTAEQVRQLQQRVANIQTQVAQIDARVAELRREQAMALAAITTDTQTALAELDLANRQLGGKSVPPPLVKPAPKQAAPPEKGPLGPLMRLLLIVVALVAILIIIKIFLGRLGDEEDEDEDELAADEEIPADETPGPTAVELPRPAEPAAPQSPAPETPAPGEPAETPEGKPKNAGSNINE